MLHLIWSNERNAWWARGARGYTRKLAEAGRFSLSRTRSIVAQAELGRQVIDGLPNEVAVPVEAIEVSDEGHWNLSIRPPSADDDADGLVWVRRTYQSAEGSRTVVVTPGRYDTFNRHWYTWRGTRIPDGSVTHWRPMAAPADTVAPCDGHRSTPGGDLVCDLDAHDRDTKCRWVPVPLPTRRG